MGERVWICYCNRLLAGVELLLQQAIGGNPEIEKDTEALVRHIHAMLGAIIPSVENA